MGGAAARGGRGRSSANADSAGFGRASPATSGYWSLVAAGGLGLVVLLVSLRRAGDDRRAGLDPWVAALGAIATIVAVVGPLIPLNGANITENWSSPPGTDLPTVYFLARFVNLGLLLVVRRVRVPARPPLRPRPGRRRRRRLGLAHAHRRHAADGQPIGPAYFNPGAAPSGAPPWTLSPEQWATIADDLKP